MQKGMLRERKSGGEAGLSVVFEQMATYFSGRAHVDDLDVLNFSLRHLFRRVDSLYRTALPELFHSTTLSAGGQALVDELQHRQCIWSKLRAISDTLRRMEQLCRLLSDAAKSTLGALDLTSEDITSAEHTVLSAGDRSEEQERLQALDSDHWDAALRTLTEYLSYWQQQYSQLVLFADAFADVVFAPTPLNSLDEVLTTLLDSSGAIFGDILPGFQAISVGDDEAAATLLFDLMQQVDLLLMQFDIAHDPLHNLLEQFSLLCNK